MIVYYDDDDDDTCDVNNTDVNNSIITVLHTWMWNKVSVNCVM